MAKISSKKVAPLLTNLIQMKIDRIVTRNYSEHILYMDAFFSVIYNKTSVKYRRLISWFSKLSWTYIFTDIFTLSTRLYNYYIFFHKCNPFINWIQVTQLLKNCNKISCQDSTKGTNCVLKNYLYIKVCFPDKYFVFLRKNWT